MASRGWLTWPLDGGRGLLHAQGMKNLMLWYLPQAALAGFGFYIASQTDPPISGMAAVIVGAMLAAAYTAAVNIFLSLIARLRSHGGQSSGDGERLAGAGRFLGDGAQQRQRIGVDKDSR